MSLNFILLLLLLLAVLYMTFIEIFTIIFMITGMSNTRAKFQVISLLTGCGFTTNESEIVVSSRKRRRIAIIVMLFGNLFNVAIVSILVEGFISFSKDKSFDVLSSTLYLLAFVAFIIILKRLPFIKVAFNNIIKKLANKVMFSKNSNHLLILDNFHGFVIVEVKVIKVPKLLKEKSLLESRISKDYNLRILTIKRNEKNIADVTKDEIIRDNDRLIIYGPLTNVIKVFNEKPSHYTVVN